MNIERWASKFPSVTIPVNGKPYLTRYYVFLKDRRWGNVYVHHFHSSDQGLELHNHPWDWGVSYILSGGYIEERVRNFRIDLPPSGPVTIERRMVRPGTLNVIRASDFHRVDLLDEERGAWSLFLAGPRTKDWGFLDRNTGEYKDWRTNPEAIP